MRPPPPPKDVPDTPTPTPPAGADKAAARSGESGTGAGTDAGAGANAGVTFDELVARLVGLPRSEADLRFGTVFFVVYRKFATPWRLLAAFIRAFHALERADSIIRQHGMQLRLVTMLAQLVREHPGDFAGQRVRRRLLEFVAYMEGNYLFAYIAKEIAATLTRYVEDYDTG
ncbi:hypothetical protein KEM52_004865, partial [Ascosphaera acerosa]